jgi:integrase
LQGKQTSSSHSVIAKAGIKDLLRKQGLTIAATAQKAALGQTTVKAILAGKTIARKTAEKLANALDAQEKDLFVPVEAQEKPLAAKTIHHYHAFISSILDRAVKWGYISDNPCRRVDPPKLQRRMIQCLNKDEAKRFLECLQSESVEKQAIFYTLLFTGVRRGELLGLEWSDIDFRKKTITIQRTSLYTQADGLFTDTTKTESSKRTIVVSDELLDVLRKHNDEQKIMKKTAGEDWVNSNRLFIEWNGAPMSPNKPYHMLQRLLKKYNLPTVSLHSLRHSNATIMIESGTDLRTTSDRLGHSQTSTTMNIYVHQIKSANERAAENISKAFSLK